MSFETLWFSCRFETVKVMPLLEFVAGSISGRKVLFLREQQKMKHRAVIVWLWRNKILLLVVVGALGLAVGHPLDTVKVAWHFETNKYDLMHKLFLIFYFLFYICSYICRYVSKPSLCIKGYFTVWLKHTLMKGWVPHFSYIVLQEILTWSSVMLHWDKTALILYALITSAPWIL